MAFAVATPSLAGLSCADARGSERDTPSDTSTSSSWRCLVGRYDRASAEAVFAPVVDRLMGLDDEIWRLGNEGPALLRAVGAFDARAARAVLDSWTEDPGPPAGRPAVGTRLQPTQQGPGPHHAGPDLGLAPGLRLGEPFLPDGSRRMVDLRD